MRPVVLASPGLGASVVKILRSFRQWRGAMSPPIQITQRCNAQAVVYPNCPASLSRRGSERTFGPKADVLDDFITLSSSFVPYIGAHTGHQRLDWTSVLAALGYAILGSGGVFELPLSRYSPAPESHWNRRAPATRSEFAARVFDCHTDELLLVLDLIGGSNAIDGGQAVW